ncbi:MAG: spore germination protein [Oscillospiraceae bacterium]|nr:spore germination protein [Oscillospiraceae bacterium]
MKEVIRKYISKNLDDNFNYIKKLMQDNSDIVYRDINFKGTKLTLIYIDGMASKDLLNNYIIEPLVKFDKNNESEFQDIESFITASDFKAFNDLEVAINMMLSGDTILLVDGKEEVNVIATRSWPNRGVSEPRGESGLRGPLDGFTETVRFNTALIRRRIRDTRLVVKSKSIGVRSKTDCAIMYIDDIVNPDIVTEVNKRLDDIHIDAILDSGYIEQLIEDNKFSIFPQIQSTERPDVVAGALYEGRVAIIIDNSPYALIVPTIFANFFQSADDYYLSFLQGMYSRVLRYLSVFLTTMLPALYISITTYNSSIIPSKLAYSIAQARATVPFPSLVETLIMEISLQLVVEAILRTPKIISSTIGIVGGLIIGQAAVTAGIVSPFMIIIISITTLTSLTTPNISLNTTYRYIRLAMIFASYFMGLYGILVVFIVVLLHLSNLKSFGVSYLAPLNTFRTNDFKDYIFRTPLHKMRKRPEIMNTLDKYRQK